MRTELQQLAAGPVSYSVRSFGALATPASTGLLFLLLIFGPLFYGAVEPWSQLVLRSGALLLVICTFLTSFTDRMGPFRVNGKVHTPMLVFAGIVAFQLVTGRTAYYEQSVQQAANWVAYGFVFLASSKLLGRDDSDQVFHGALCIFGFCYALYALILHFGWPGELFWSRLPRAGGAVFGSYVNRNHYAGLMEMIAPLAIVAALRKDFDLSKRLLFAFCGMLMLASVFVCGSRGGMLACSVELCILAMLSGGRQLLQGYWVYPACAFAVLVAWLGGAVVAERLGTVADVAQGPGVRVQILRDGLRMAATKPVLGWGLGSFSVVFPEYRSFFSQSFFSEAHNDYLQMLVETGIGGLASFLAFIFGAIKTGLAEWDLWQADPFSNFSVGALLGMAGLMAHSFTDFNLQIPANALLFFSLCGIACRSRRTSEI